MAQACWLITASKEGRYEMTIQKNEKLSNLIVQELQLYNELLHKIALQKTAVIKNQNDLLLEINEELMAMQRQASQYSQQRQQVIAETGQKLEPQQQVAIQQVLHQIREQISDNHQMINLANDFVTKKIGFWVDLFNANNENYTATGETQAASPEIQYSTVIRQV